MNFHVPVTTNLYDTVIETLDSLFGLHTQRLATGQMMARAILIFFVALLFVRISGIRTLGKQNAFDNLTVLILGAIMGRSIVAADQPFFESLGAVLLLMVLHRLMALITFHSKRAGVLFKGKNILLFKDGKKQEDNMKRTNITEDDLLEASRKQANVATLNEVKEAHLERSGDISIVK